jgi:hypothetical protein
MSTNCEYCGYRDNEVKSGGAIAEKGKKIILKVEDEEDLSRDLLKVSLVVSMAIVLLVELQLTTTRSRPQPLAVRDVRPGDPRDRPGVTARNPGRTIHHHGGSIAAGLRRAQHQGVQHGRRRLGAHGQRGQGQLCQIPR